MPQRPYDEALLRRSFAIARQAREVGDHPFGCLLADADGHILMEQGNGYSAEGNDRTAHAEKLLATRAAKALFREKTLKFRDLTLGEAWMTS